MRFYRTAEAPVPAQSGALFGRSGGLDRGGAVAVTTQSRPAARRQRPHTPPPPTRRPRTVARTAQLATASATGKAQGPRTLAGQIDCGSRVEGIPRTASIEAWATPITSSGCATGRHLTACAPSSATRAPRYCPGSRRSQRTTKAASLVSPLGDARVSGGGGFSAGHERVEALLEGCCGVPEVGECLGGSVEACEGVVGLGQVSGGVVSRDGVAGEGGVDLGVGAVPVSADEVADQVGVAERVGDAAGDQWVLVVPGVADEPQPGPAERRKKLGRSPIPRSCSARVPAPSRPRSAGRSSSSRR